MQIVHPNTHFYSCEFDTFYFMTIHNDTESVSIAGGTFALYSLLCRHVNIGILPSKHVSLNSTKDVQKSTLLAKFFQTSLVARRLLLFVAMLGTCMLIGDGILTPAISGLVTEFFLFCYSVSFQKSLMSFLLLWNVFIQLCWIWFSVLSAMDGLRAPFPSVSKCKLWGLFGFTAALRFCSFHIWNTVKLIEHD